MTKTQTAVAELSPATQTVAGHTLTLEPGIRYRASRPWATRERTEYPVTIAPLDAIGMTVTISGLTYAEANALVNGFNNGAMSFDGRVW